VATRIPPPRGVAGLCQIKVSKQSVKNKLENPMKENIGKDEQAPIDENTKKLAGSAISKEEIAAESKAETAEEESMEDVFGDLDISTEEFLILAQKEKEDVENSKEVLLDEPAIVKPDIKKIKPITQEMNDGTIVDLEVFSVVWKHPKFGDIQKTITLSKQNAIKWRKLMMKTHKSTYKVTKKGRGFDTRYRFEPVEAA
jgi:hypothetical protein